MWCYNIWYKNGCLVIIDDIRRADIINDTIDDIRRDDIIYDMIDDIRKDLLL